MTTTDGVVLTMERIPRPGCAVLLPPPPLPHTNSVYPAPRPPAGYPLEVHTVTTSDGVVLTMERIPRPGRGRVAFFLHGILDTSLTWVSSGVTGSQVGGLY